jgi:ubiquinone/menaquinone biosynthesis C-methylase UbiE
MFSDPIRNIAQFNIGPTMSVADLGAGAGFYTFEAAKRVGHDGKVYAVEVQRELIEKVKKMATQAHVFNIEVILGDAERIGGTHLKEDSIDRVIASNILFQIEDKNTFCLEIKRILKRGRVVMIIDWSESSSIGHQTIVSESSARALFEKHGFTYERTFSAGDHHYGLIFRK